MNSMSENQNLLVSDEPCQVLTIDLKSTIGQFLSQLAHAGMETLPKGRDHIPFVAGSLTHNDGIGGSVSDVSDTN